MMLLVIHKTCVEKVSVAWHIQLLMSHESSVLYSKGVSFFSV